MTEKGDYLSLERTRGLRFVMAVLVLMSHVDDRFGYETGEIGPMAVGVFFFLSAYGLMHSMQTKPKYLGSFVQKRVPALLVPWWVCGLVGAVVALVFLSTGAHTIESVVTRLADGIFGPLIWFVLALLTFYVLFYLCFLLVRNKRTAVAVLSVAVCVASVLMDLRFDNHVYTLSTSGFVGGLLWAHFRSEIDALLSRYGWASAVLLVCCAVAIPWSFELFGKPAIYPCVPLFVLMTFLLQRSCAAYSAVLLAALVAIAVLFSFSDITYILIPISLCICIIATKMPLTSRLCSLGGVIAYEFFLLNWPAINLVDKVTSVSPFWSTVLTFVVIIPMSIAAWYVSRKILDTYNNAYDRVCSAEGA